MKDNNGIMNFDFNLKTNARFGPYKALKLPLYLSELSLTRIGLIIDGGIARLEYMRQIRASLESNPDLTVKTWVYNLGHEPDYDSLDQVKQQFTGPGGVPLVDCFVGIGGGSAIDFAKGLSTVVVNPGDAVQYKGFPTNIRPPLPTIAIPTTAGTGSEVTYNAVFTDNKMKKKLGINTRLNYPVLAILDPVLTVNSPVAVTVSSGMDALVHTLESYAAVQSNTMNRIFAREAFRLVFNNLSRVLDKPGDLEIRSKIQIGAYLAGISLINSGSGPAGALSYPLGVHFKVPHGLAGAVFIPHIIRHNISCGYDYSELYNLIDSADRSIPEDRKNKDFSTKLSELCWVLDIPDTLRPFGVDAKSVEILCKEAGLLEKAFAQNPVLFSVRDAQDLLRKMAG
jgi:alcohol dehydrogenase